MKAIINGETGAVLFQSDLDIAVEIWYSNDRDHRRVYHWAEIGCGLPLADRDALRLLYQSRHLRAELWVVPVCLTHVPY